MTDILDDRVRAPKQWCHSRSKSGRKCNLYLGHYNLHKNKYERWSDAEAGPDQGPPKARYLGDEPEKTSGEPQKAAPEPV